MPGNGLQVIGMHGLSVFLHHIVGDVHQVIDGADSHGSQPSLHPLRGRPDLDILDDPCTVTRAQVRIFHRNLHIVVDVLVISCLCHHRRHKCFVKCSRSFSCDPDHTEAVHPVGRHLIFHDYIVQSQCLDRVLTNLSILRENVDAFLRRFRIHFSETWKWSGSYLLLLPVSLLPIPAVYWCLQE